MTPVPPGWTCPRRVGFLFPHDCLRTTPVGCPDCQNGQIDDPYGSRSDRYGYDLFDSYSSNYFLMRAFSAGIASTESDSSAAASADFTEADGADLVQPGDQFENDMTES